MTAAETIRALREALAAERRAAVDAEEMMAQTATDDALDALAAAMDAPPPEVLACPTCEGQGGWKVPCDGDVGPESFMAVGCEDCGETGIQGSVAAPPPLTADLRAALDALVEAGDALDGRWVEVDTRGQG